MTRSRVVPSLFPSGTKRFHHFVVQSVLFLLLLNVLVAKAQDLAGLEQGIKPYGSYQGGSIDSISMVNGSLTLNIPIISYPQRGGRLHLGFVLTYANAILQPYANCNPAKHICTSSGYQVNHRGQSPDQTAISLVPDFTPSYVEGISTPSTVTSFDGAIHEMGNVGTTGTNFISVDTTGYVFTQQGSNLNWGTLTDRAGNKYTTPSGTFEDANGNLITQNTNSSGVATSWTDTLGRNIPVPSNATVTSDFSGCTGSQPTKSASIWNAPGPNGGNSPFKFCTASFALSFVPPDCVNDLQHSYCTGGGGSASYLQSLVLPNGTAWTFEYDNFGELSSVTLPTGGTISYTWTYTSGLCVGPEYINSGVATGLYPYGRAVTSRTVNANDGTGPRLWSYALSSTLIQGNLQTVVTDPASNDTVHSQTALSNTCSLYETELDQYSGSHTSGTLLRKVATAYTYTYGGTGFPYGNVTINVVPSTITTTLGGQVSQTTKTYDSGIGVGGGYNAIYGDLLTESNYDFGSGSPGGLLRETTNTYMALSGPNSASYLANNLLDLPYTVQVNNGTGACGSSSAVSCTTYGYDEWGLQTSNVTEQKTTGERYPGNRTSIQRSLNGSTVATTNCNVSVSNGYLVSKNVFYDTGEVQQSTDPCSYATIYQYSSTYYGAYPTLVTNALGQNTTYGYDFNAGAITSITDPNSQPTTKSYDSMARLTQVSYPDGGSTSYCYTDGVAANCPSGNTGNAAFAVVVTKAITSSTNEISTATLDGLARLSQTQLNSDPDGIDYVDTTYDGLGRKSTVSNPHRTGSSTTDGITTYVYDALSRVCAVGQPDGSAVSQSSGCPTTAPAGDVFTQYSGNCTTVSDEAGKLRKSCFDGLGRLTGAWEDPSGLNYETDYQYNALSNLTSVTQKGSSGGTARTRTFQYDSLSQLTTASNPESGTITYGYDADGNVITKTAPLQNQTGTATVTITNTYDKLNRLTGKSYTDGGSSDPYTPTVQFGYDGMALTGCTPAPPGLTDSYPIGRRTAMCDGSGGAASWKHDTMGRILQERRTTGPVVGDYSTDTYTLDGLPAVVTTIGGYSESYTYGGAARPLSVTNYTGGTNRFVSGATYTPPGELATMTNGSTSTFTGIVTNNAYNNRLQPILLSAGVSGQNPVFSLCFDFHLGIAVNTPPCSFSASTLGNNGNAYQVVNNRDATRTQIFTYDSLNRIASAQSSGSQWGETFTIDAWGNLTNENGIAGKTYHESLSTSAGTNNQLAGYGYDAAGNMTNNGSTSYVYDAENRLVWTSGYRYLYGGDGQRVEKCIAATATTACPTSGTNGTLYWRGLGNDPLTETDLSGNTIENYIFFNGQRVARRDASTNAIHYYFSDHLGSHGVVEDATADTCEQDIDYFPYGGVQNDYCAAVPQKYKFTGKERDSESGLDNFGKRYNASSMGRFMTPDPLHIMKQKLIDPQQWNMYAYVRNNPLRFTDPTGMYTCADQSNCKSKQDKAFETARQNDLKSKDPAVVAAAKAYGDPTKANGVGVAFAKSLPEGCNGSACTQASVSFADGKAQFSQNVTFKTGLSGTELDAAVGHEGVHVGDAQAFAATVTPDFHYDLSKNLTSFQTEMNAYRVTQSIWDAAGKTASYGQCGGGQCLFGPGTNVDATTIMLLANPANGYNHFVDDGNGSYVNQLGLRQLPAVDTPNP